MNLPSSERSFASGFADEAHSLGSERVAHGFVCDDHQDSSDTTDDGDPVLQDRTILGLGVLDLVQLVELVHALGVLGRVCG